MQPRAVLFDLDGTLLYTMADIANAMNRVLVAHDREAKPVETYASMVGWGLRRLVELCVPEEEHSEELLSQYTAEVVDAYHASPTAETVPYPGIVDLLDTLAERGVGLAALSNKLDSLTRVIIDETLGLKRFRVVQGSLAGVPKKPDPAAALDISRKLEVEPSACLFVGDTAIDMETARNAGMPSCGVTWGYRPEAELKAAGADHIVQSTSEILQILDSAATASTTGGAQ